MKKFKGSSLHLETPDDWTDASTYILAAPRTQGFVPTLVITVTQQVVYPELQRHMDQQLYELQKLSGFKLFERRPVADSPKGQTGVLEFQWDNNKRGPELYQKQVYYMVGQTVWCLTATSPVTLHHSIMPALNKVMATFQPQQWEGEKSTTIA